MNFQRQDDPLNPTTTTSVSRNSDPRFHVPKVDKETGQPIPQWKQQLLLTKITKKRAAREEGIVQEKSQSENALPDWKKEIMAKKEQRLMASDDPIQIRKRRIRSFEQEYNSSDIPPWKKELLKKKIHQIKDEISELELQEQKSI